MWPHSSQSGHSQRIFIFIFLTPYTETIPRVDNLMKMIMVMTPVMTTKNDNNQLQWQWSWQWWQYKLMIWKIFIKIHRLYFQTHTQTSHQKKPHVFGTKIYLGPTAPAIGGCRIFSPAGPSRRLVGWQVEQPLTTRCGTEKPAESPGPPKTADSQWMILVLVKGPQTKVFGLYLVYNKYICRYM